MLGPTGCGQHSGISWHFPPSRRPGSGENRLPSPPGLRTCWSDRCTSISLLCVCAIPMEVPPSRSRRGTHGKHFRNGCNITSPAPASLCARKSFQTLASGWSHAAVFSSPSVSTPRAASSRQRVIAPTFRPRSTSCCSPSPRITPRQRFRTRASSTSGRERKESFAKPATSSNSRWRNEPPNFGGARPI